jgi:CRP/FNR family transcriptional regulator, cyclic AMP receptor protein
MKLNDELILAILKGLHIFKDVDNSALIQLGRLCKERIYDHQEIIIEEGTIGNSMMVIASGEVRVSQKPGPEAEETLVILKKGDVFGEMALLEDLPRSATIIAHSNVIALEISREDFLSYIKKDCQNGVEILLKLSRILSSRLRQTDDKLKAFISLSQWL